MVNLLLIGGLLGRFLQYGYSLPSLLALLVTILLLTAARNQRRNAPGPKRLPILGNALQMPRIHPWVTYSNWAKEFKTEVLYLNVLGFHIVILDSAKAAKDLLDKRSAIYSDRPRFPFFDLMGWTWAVQFIGYGETFRRHRKPLQTYLSQSNLPVYWPTQQKEVRLLLKDLFCSPENFLKHCNHAAAGMTMTILYGIARGPKRTSMIHIAEEATESLVVAGNFGDHFVDIMPIMKYIPECVPGATFQKQAREWRTLSERMINVPFQDIKERLKTGYVEPCLVAKLLEVQAGGQDPDMTDYLIKSTAGVIYLGGADTTLSAIQTFFLAMTLYPDVQRQAQAEIDAVCGRRRLPTLDDKPSMTYLECIMRELFRWNPTTPLGVPHRVSQDDIYEGYLIPKGSIIMANIWSIFHNAAIYPDPLQFKPNRYLCKSGEIDPDIMDPRTLAFGFGRRLCPGRFVGDSAVWTIISSILATFNVAKAIDSKGKEITPSTEYTTGLVSRPLPFQCAIIPRDDIAREIILSSLDDSQDCDV